MRNHCYHADNSERGLSPLFVLREHNHAVMCASFYPSMPITNSESTKLTSSIDYSVPHSSVEFTKYGHLFISGDAGGVVNIWDLNLRRVIYTFRPAEMVEKWMLESGDNKNLLMGSQGSNVGLLNVGFLSLQINEERQEHLSSPPPSAQSKRGVASRSVLTKRELSQEKEDDNNSERQSVSTEKNRMCTTQKVNEWDVKTNINSSEQSNHHYDIGLSYSMSPTQNDKQWKTEQREQLQEKKRLKSSGIARQMHERGFRKFFAHKHHHVVNDCNKRLKDSNVSVDHHPCSKQTRNTVTGCCDNGVSDELTVYIYTQCRTRCLYIWEVKIRNNYNGCNNTKSEKENCRVNNMQTHYDGAILETKENTLTHELANSSLSLLHCIPVPQYGFCQVACDYDERINSYLFAVPHDAQSTFSIWAVTLRDEWQQRHLQEMEEKRKQLNPDVDACAHHLPHCYNLHAMQYHSESSPFLLTCLCTSSATASLSNVNGGIIMSLSLSKVEQSNIINQKWNNNNYSCFTTTNDSENEECTVSTRHLAVGLESGHVALCKLQITKRNKLKNVISTNEGDFSSAKQTSREEGKECQEMTKERSHSMEQWQKCVKDETYTCNRENNTVSNKNTTGEEEEYDQTELLQERMTDYCNNDIVIHKNKFTQSRIVNCVCVVLCVLRLFAEPAMTCVWSTIHNYLLASSASGDVHCYLTKLHSQTRTSLLPSNPENENKEQTKRRYQLEQDKEVQKNQLYFNDKSKISEEEIGVEGEHVTISLLWQKSLCKGIGSANLQRHLAMLGSWDGSVRLFDARTGRVVSILLEHSSTINAITAMDVQESGRASFAFDIREPHEYSPRLHILKNKQVQ